MGLAGEMCRNWAEPYSCAQRLTWRRGSLTTLGPWVKFLL